MTKAQNSNSDDSVREKPARVRKAKNQVEPLAEVTEEKPKRTRKPKPVAEVETAEPKAPKAKKTCSEAQLAALAKGREALVAKRLAK